MKILLVAGKLSYSNPAIYTLEMVRGLQAAGHQIEVALHGGPLCKQVEKLANCYQIKRGIFTRRKLLQFLKEFDPEVIHATGGSQALATAAEFSRQLGKPLLHTLHGWLPEDQKENYPRNLNGVIAVNQALREHLVNEINMPKNRIRVIPYGVSSDLSVLRSQRGSISVVGTIGRLDRGRRHDEFLRSARLVRDRDLNVHFVVAGEGPDERRLRKLADELKLNDCTTFVQPQASIEIFSAIDLLVVVSDWGGVGLSLLESMVQRCPVIATVGGELISMMNDEGNCVLVPPNDQERLAGAIQKMLADSAAREAMTESAYNYVLANHTLEAHIHSLTEYYEGVLNASYS